MGMMGALVSEVENRLLKAKIKCLKNCGYRGNFGLSKGNIVNIENYIPC